MTKPRMARDINTLNYRWLDGQVPRVYDSGPIVAPTPANAAIFEIDYSARTHGAVQVYSTDGNAISGTFKVQGSLKDPTTVATTETPITAPKPFLVSSTDADYADIATQTGAGIVQIPVNSAYARVRVICTVVGTGAPGVRLL